MQTAEDRERDLWIAHQRYMNKEIEIDELERLESIHADHLRKAILELSKQDVKRQLRNKISNFFRYKKSP